MTQSSNECPRCQRLRKRLAKVQAENEQLHQLAAHYRERTELQRQLTALAEAPPDTAKH